jgi:hypothetical protein
MTILVDAALLLGSPRVLSTGVLKKFIQVYIMENLKISCMFCMLDNFLSTKNEMILNAKLYFEG